MLIANATLLDGARADVRLGATIVAVAEALRPEPGEHVLDAKCGTVLPGLHDHHVHLWATAAALESAPAGPPRVRTADELRAVLATATTDPDGWIRAVGYHDSVAGPLDRHRLDELAPAVPVRVQHRSGAFWTLNTIALQRIGADGHEDGRFFRTDPGVPVHRLSLRAVSRRLSALGVTGVTEATPGYSQMDIETFTHARQQGELDQRLHCMALPGTCPTAEVGVGPAKLILDDPTLDLDAVCAWVSAAHTADHPVAVHAVTDSQLIVTIAALKAVGVHPGDRIEHAAVVPDDVITDLEELGVTVVTQPNFIAERGDEYLTDVEAAQRDQLWRVDSLRRAGIPTALSTDAPFGDADPWAAMRAAVRRRAPSGATLGTDEKVDPRTALTMFLGHPEQPAHPRRIAVGQPGDVIVLSAAPPQVLAELDAGLVVATVIGGELTYSVR